MILISDQKLKKKLILQQYILSAIRMQCLWACLFLKGPNWAGNVFVSLGPLMLRTIKPYFVVISVVIFIGPMDSWAQCHSPL